MPLLGRLFAKKNKIPPRAEILDDNSSLSPTFAPTTESHESSNSSYVTPDISVPSQPNAQTLYFGRAHEQGPTSTSATSGGGGLRLFRRKKSTNPSTELIASSTGRSEFGSPQRLVLPRPSDTAADLADLRRLRPPPSRSAIFAAYADSGSSLSTRSLPENQFRPASPLLSPSPSPPPASSQKRPSLFGWVKPASRSSSNTGSNLDISLRTPSECSELPAEPHSFNLKSFRHIGAASQPPLANRRPGSLSPPIPRPRGTGFHSDSSQRISVAAFREVQARRSQTGSPVPSPNESPPSTLPASSPIKPEGLHPGYGPRPSRSSAALLQTSRQRRSSFMVSSTDEDNSSSEADSEGESVRGKSHQRPGRKAQSELGHGSMATESSFKRANALVRAPRASRSHVGHAISNSSPRPRTEFEQELKRPELPSRPQSTPGLYESPNKLLVPASTTTVNRSVAGHERNSSASSNVTDSTARKVTPQAASNQQLTKGKTPVVDLLPRNSDSDSEDNAPLASLIAPKRPGSAMSSYSNPRSISGQTIRSAGHAKPLIDVNEVISSKPTSVSSPSPPDSAFTHGPTLLSAVKTAPVVHCSSPLASPNPKLADLTRIVPPVKFVSPPSSPVKQTTELVSPNLDERRAVEKRSETSTSVPSSQHRESSPEQTRDPLSDRLSRAVQKSLPNPINSGSTLATTISKPLEGATNRLSVATSSESLQTRQSYEAARITLPRNPPPIIQPSKDEYSPPDEDLAKLLGSVGIKLISRTGDPDETSSSESSEEEIQKDEDMIAPIPIKQRAPPPAFAVTSRPAFPRLPEQSSTSSSLEVKNLSEQAERKFPATVRPSDYPSVRQRSASMLPSLSSSSFPSSNASPSTRNSKVTSYLTSPSATDVSTKSTSSGVSPTAVGNVTTVRPAVGVRQKSNMMVTGVPLSSQVPRHFNAPERRFAAVRGNSPSSSGDSSSGRAPHTPRDSGEVCVAEDQVQKRMSSTTKAEEWSRGPSGLGIKRQNAHAKRRSVSFEDDVRGLNTQPSKSHIREAATAGTDAIGGGRHVRECARAGPDRDISDEEAKGKKEEKEKEAKRKERRRQETQAAIELGNVMHGPPPVLDDDNNDMPTNPAMNRHRVSAFNPMMVMNPMTMPMTYTPPSGPGGWVPNMAQPMLSPGQFMIPQPSNPNMMAAHQQAMMVAKQAYQMAVAQHAMAAAAEEWERGSALGGFGSTGSVYGSTAPSMINAQSGMMGGMGMMPGMQGNAAGAMWPSSLYGGMGAIPRFGHYLSPGDMQFSSSRSDHGAHAASSRMSGNWGSSKSMYGEQPNESFSRKASGQQQQQSSRQQMWNAGRDSMHLPPVPPIPASKNMTGRGSPEPKGPSRLRTTSQPTTPTRSAFARKAIPPSSWRPSGS